MGHYASEMGYEPPGMKEHRARIKKINKLIDQAVKATNHLEEWRDVKLKLLEAKVHVEHVKF